MSTRIDKVNSLLEHEISKIIARDFGFAGSLVTLTHVDTSPNLIQTKAYVSVLPPEKTDHIIAVLNRGVYDVQKKINGLLNMRPVPKIIFVKDHQTADAANVEAILETLKNENK